MLPPQPKMVDAAKCLKGFPSKDVAFFNAGRERHAMCYYHGAVGIHVCRMGREGMLSCSRSSNLNMHVKTNLLWEHTLWVANMPIG